MDVRVDFGTGPIFGPGHVYTPVLSTKRAEREALRGVTRVERSAVAPMIVLRALPKKGRAVGKDTTGKTTYAAPRAYAQHLADQIGFLREISEDEMGMFGRFERLFLEVDLLQSAKASGSVLSDVMHKIGQVAADYVPVTDPDRPLRHQNAVRDWHAAHGSGVAIMLRGIDALPTLADLEGLLEHAGCASTEADLFIDAGSIVNEPVAPLASAVSAAIASYSARSWRRICVLAGGFPESIKDFPFDKTAIVRRDLALYLATRAQSATPNAARLFFGDYASLHTEIVEGFGAGETPPNIRYADAEFWFVYRRETTREMPDLCRAILADFPDVPKRENRGDKWILKQANGMGSAETAETWVLVGLSHHIWFVVRQMNGLA